VVAEVVEVRPERDAGAGQRGEGSERVEQRRLAVVAAVACVGDVRGAVELVGVDLDVRDATASSEFPRGRTLGTGQAGRDRGDRHGPIAELLRGDRGHQRRVDPSRKRDEQSLLAAQPIPQRGEQGVDRRLHAHLRHFRWAPSTATTGRPELRAPAHRGAGVRSFMTLP
jgi:hypothetical protein